MDKKEKVVKKTDAMEAKEYVMSNKLKNNWITFLKEFHTHKIEKKGYNNYNKYDYYRLEDIEKPLVKTQIKTGMNLTLVNQSPLFVEGLEYMVFYYEFNDGEKKFEFIFRADNTQKNDTQGSGATSTYGTRYSLMRLLGISEDEADPDNDKNTKKTKKVEKQAPVKKSVLKTIKIEPQDVSTPKKEVVKETVEQPEPEVKDMAKQIRKSVFANKTKKLNDIKITNKEGE